MIGEAYSLGIEYYITKPINRLEILSVLRLVEERLRMQQSIQDIQRTLQGLTGIQSAGRHTAPVPNKTISTAGHFLLSEMGMIGEAGSKDLLDMLEYLEQIEAEDHTISP
jgi:two-component system response regulator YcbB